jgi:hypothetical protein
MDKYGVEDSSDKTASDEGCPLCGAKLEDTDVTGIRKCPVHGTEPFESGGDDESPKE